MTNHRNAGFRGAGKLIFLPLCLVLSSCTLEHSRQASQRFFQNAGLASQHTVSRSGEWSLTPGTRVCHLQKKSQDGTYAQSVDQALYRALLQRFQVSRIDLDRNLLSRTEKLDTCQLLVESEVLRLDNEAVLTHRHGEERAGSAVAGDLTVRIILYEAVTGRVLDVGLVRSRAGLVTPMATLPDRFIDTAMQAYVARLAP